MSMHRRTTRHRPAAGRRAGVVLAGLALLVLTVSGAMAPANAAKGGNGGGKPGGGGKPPAASDSSLALRLVDSADTEANHGDHVTFDVSTTSTDRPFVSVNCYQAGAWVYSASVGFFEDYPWAQELRLSSSSWTDGAADCTARLYMTKDGSRTTTLATLDFHVSA